MERNDDEYRLYTEILKEELIPAMGCTEPIAIAYAAARCRDLLGGMPESCRLEVSGSIIKNVKSVVVPNTGGMKGIEPAVAAGIVGGRAEDGLQVIAGVKKEQLAKIVGFMSGTKIDVVPSNSGITFYIDITEYAAGHSARAVIAYYHTNFIRLEKDGAVIWDKAGSEDPSAQGADRSKMSVSGIWEYTNCVELADVENLISRQIEFNSVLSAEGMKNAWGAQIGRVLRDEWGNDLRVRACAAAAAGSDARMNGCELPAVIISGSGNQGITATMPVVVYADALGCGREKLYRALVLSDLVTVHQKTGIGSVSAFCGAVCAGVGAGCGAAYLMDADYKAICHTIVNALAVLSGMICDGAKPSCAAKIYEAVDAGLLGYAMYKHGQQFYGGDGIVKKGVENTISSVCEVAREGMKETNERILEVMLRK